MQTLCDFLNLHGYVRKKLHLTKTNHFEIIAIINNKKGRFILDTGASNSCVGMEEMTYFNLHVENSDILAAGAGAIDMATKLSKNNTIKIGQWQYDKLHLVLFDLSHVNTALINHNANPVRGIIGADILKKGKAIIDYDKKYLYLKN